MPRAVPYAADSGGGLADPRSAPSGQSFTCLECGEGVILRREHLRQGRTVAAHFSHQAGSTCAGENVLHLAAKLRLVEALRARERPFMIHRVCQRYGCDETQETLWEPPAFDSAQAEVSLGTYRLDVAALCGKQVAVAFEVYFSHRVGTVKAAGLGVPWLELQAEATAADAYLLRPVVDEQIIGEDEQELRAGLNVTRAELPKVLRWRLGLAFALRVRVNGNRVPGHLVNRLFESRREGVSFLTPWWCPACLAAREEQARLLELLEQQEREDARLRAIQEAKAKAEQAQRAVEQLGLQRAIFGSGLRRPFEVSEVPFYQAHAPVIREVTRYLQRHLAGRMTVTARLELWRDESLVARRCWHCKKPILCLAPSGFVPHFNAFYPMVEYFKPEAGRRGYLVSKCLYCDRRQQNRQVREGGHVLLLGEHLLIWLEAFDQP